MVEARWTTMDCSCTLFLPPGPITQILTVLVLPFLLIGRIPTANGGTIRETENITWAHRTKYSDVKFERLISYPYPRSESLCSNKTDGMYGHPQSLSSYYKCNKGEYELLQCNEGLVFNELSLTCEQRVFHHSASDVNPCDTQPNGFIPDYFSKNCNQYYKCENGVLIERKTCDLGMRFSIADRHCKPFDQVICPQIHCHESSDGYFITPGTMCKAYYACSNGKINNYICPLGLAFNRTSQTCTGSGGTCYELLCTGRVNGLYADTTHNCERYYLCEGGELKSVGGCPQGTLFNGTSCITSSEVSCSSVENTAIGLELPVADLCTGLQDGPHPLSHDYCQQYILCKSEIMLAELQCPKGQNFNGKKCIHADLAPCNSFCKDKSNGLHANVKKYCEEYVDCLDGNILSINRCSKGSVFDGKICVPSLLHQCPIIQHNNFTDNKKCLNLKDGFHTDYLSGCKEYFYCYKNELLNSNICMGDTLWNGSECISSSHFKCQGPQFSPECVIRGNGLFTDISKRSKCNEYYYCHNGLQVNLQCPNNQVFDGNQCVSSEFFNCPLTETDCYHKADGYYADLNSGCQTYYYCSNGNKIIYLCPNKHIFNGSDCVLTETYHCPSNESHDCHNLNNGYYPDMKENCEKYFYCSNNKKVMTLSCPPNEIFNGDECVPSETNACRNHSKISCSFLKDNTYIKPNSNCKEYFQCISKKMIGLNECSDGYAYNGTACIKMSHDFCETIMKKQTDDLLKCNKNNNGFFPDLISGCKSYFYCINGVKTTLSCPLGKLFNGDICVSDSNFYCPTSNIIP